MFHDQRLSICASLFSSHYNKVRATPIAKVVTGRKIIGAFIFIFLLVVPDTEIDSEKNLHLRPTLLSPSLHP